MKIGPLPWNITLKLLQGWYVLSIYLQPLLSLLHTYIHTYIYIYIFFFCIDFEVSHATLQVMLYVDMEVNGFPLKVTTR